MSSIHVAVDIMLLFHVDIQYLGRHFNAVLSGHSSYRTLHLRPVVCRFF